MITGVRWNLRVLLDQRAGLVAVEARHHDVDEHEVGLVVGDLGERVEAVLGQDDRAPACSRKISALRRMVFESSITITFTPCNGFCSANYFSRSYGLGLPAALRRRPHWLRRRVCHGPSELTRA